MSLPSIAVFFNNKEIVSESFVNCGWFLNSDSIVRLLREMEYPEKWDIVYLYGSLYKKNEIKNLLDIYDGLNEYWKKKINKWDSGSIKNAAEDIKVPYIRKTHPKLIAKDIISIQPLREENDEG